MLRQVPRALLLPCRLRLSFGSVRGECVVPARKLTEFRRNSGEGETGGSGSSGRAAQLSSGLGPLLQPALHTAMIGESGLLRNHLSTSQDKEVGDGSNVVPSGKLRLLLRVYLQHQGSAGHFFGELFYLRPSHAAGRAPLCPKVDEHRNLRLLDDLIEGLLIDLHRGVGYRKLRFAISAIAHLVQPGWRNPILLTTGLTNSNHVFTPL